jgi:hypothetical protein
VAGLSSETGELLTGEEAERRSGTPGRRRGWRPGPRGSVQCCREAVEAEEVAHVTKARARAEEVLPTEAVEVVPRELSWKREEAAEEAAVLKESIRWEEVHPEVEEDPGVEAAQEQRAPRRASTACETSAEAVASSPPAEAASSR